jgi:MoxR-like ATPase
MENTSDYAPPPPSHEPPQFTRAAQLVSAIREQVKRVFLGQRDVLDQVLAAFLAGGHVLVEGKPGLGKTHLVLALARTFGGHFRRIQFTPDLMPSDVTGHTLYDMGAQQFRLRRGPVFTNLLLADEINRAPAKTQAALLEVMQEVQVTIDGESHALPPPFMTLATQNPIEQEGTYPLPEAQLDRFLMKVLIDYPTQRDEEQVVSELLNGTGLRTADLAPVCTVEDVLALQSAVAAVQVVPEVVSYAVRLTRATREAQGIALGAGTRGAISLVRVAKSFAAMAGRDFVTPDDIKSAALPVLRHRVTIAPELAISGQTVDQSFDAIVRNTEAPRR